MASEAAPAPVLVAAFGNPLAGDDAFGPAVAGRLQADPVPGVEVLEAGSQPAAIVPRLAGRRRLIVVDAAVGAAGAAVDPDGLIVLDYFDPRRPPLAHERPLSSHGLAVADELRLAERLGRLPPAVTLIAAPADHLRLGEPMSRRVRQLVEPARRRILQLVKP